MEKYNDFWDLGETQSLIFCADQIGIDILFVELSLGLFFLSPVSIPGRISTVVPDKKVLASNTGSYDDLLTMFSNQLTLTAA